MGAMVGLMAKNMTNQNSFNQRSWKQEKALMNAEYGVERLITALAHENDGITWAMKDVNSAPAIPPAGFWLWDWQSIKDDNGKEVGRYKVEMLPDPNSPKVMRIKATGMAFNQIKNGQPQDTVARSIGVNLKRITLGDFAIASNHQLGGARINGGARVYGGMLTSGNLSMDASSTGIFNDYTDLQDSQNFGNYTPPTESPNGEVFVYKDSSLPTNADNGVITLAAQATLGTSSAPMQGIHTAEDSLSVDPGNGGTGTDGDGILGNGQDNAKGTKDHKLPDIDFPDASAGSSFMEARKTDAGLNGSALYVGDITFGSTSFTIGTGPALSYNASTGVVDISGEVYIEGDVTAPNPLKYTGKGGLFIEGNFTAPKGIEPNSPADFPHNSALAIVSSGDMSLGQNSGQSSKYAGFFFGSQSLNVQKAKIFGNVFGNVVNLPTTGTRPDIYVHPALMESTGVELPDFINAQIMKDLWWEMNGAAKG